MRGAPGPASAATHLEAETARALDQALLTAPASPPLRCSRSPAESRCRSVERKGDAPGSGLRQEPVEVRGPAVFLHGGAPSAAPTYTAPSISPAPASRRPCVWRPTRFPPIHPPPRPTPATLPATALLSPGFSVIEDEPAEVIETAADGVTPTVVAPRIELTLEWLVESPPPEHTWEEPPIFYDGELLPPPSSDRPAFGQRSCAPVWRRRPAPSPWLACRRARHAHPSHSAPPYPRRPEVRRLFRSARLLAAHARPSLSHAVIEEGAEVAGSQGAGKH